MKSWMIAALGLVAVGCAGVTDDSAAAANADLTATVTDAATTGDGTPVRNQCTTTFGSALTGSAGRLDGVVVAVIPAGTRTCHGDSTHVHLQVLSKGAVYDVAINVDGGNMAEKDLPLPGIAWSDGWHAGQRIEYVHDLGLHATDFQYTGSIARLDQKLEAALATANHVSVYATTYSHGGMHLVHRSRSSSPSATDGAVITDPLSPTAHVYAFHFADQSF